jgi:hypothetical protein
LNDMKRSILLALALTIGGATALAAQARPAPRSQAGVYGLMYTNLSAFDDPGTASRWVFDDNAFGLGLLVNREFGQGLLLGADVSFARPAYERRALGATTVIASGTSTVATALLSGQLAYGGAADLGFYLTGGLGTIAYNLEDVGGWNSDFALRAGTGLQYRPGSRTTLFLEWGRIWGYHEQEGLGGGRQQHSQLKLGARLGF